MVKPYAQQVDEFMEGTEYGTLAQTIDVFDEETLRLALAEYEEAQRFITLSLNADFQLLVRKLEERAEEEARRQRDYRGVDPLQKEKLSQSQRNADYAIEQVKGIISNAEETPRPVLRKLPK